MNNTNPFPCTTYVPTAILEALAKRNLMDNEKRVILAILAGSTNKPGSATMNIKTIAKHLGMKPRYVIPLVNNAINKKLVIAHTSGEGRTIRVYSIRPPMEWNPLG